MGQNGVSDQLLGRLTLFCCNDIYYHTNIILIGAVGGDIWRIGSEKWGSRRGQLDIIANPGSIEAQVLSATSGYWTWLLSVPATILNSHFKSTLGSFCGLAVAEMDGHPCRPLAQLCNVCAWCSCLFEAGTPVSLWLLSFFWYSVGPLWLGLFCLPVKEFYGTQYQSGLLFLNFMWGVVFSACVVYLLYLHWGPPLIPLVRDLIIFCLSCHLPHAGSLAKPFGNSCGIIGLYFASIESCLVNLLDLPDVPDAANSVAAGAATGALFRSPRGPRQAAAAAVVGMVGGGTIAALRTVFPSLWV